MRRKLFNILIFLIPLVILLAAAWTIRQPMLRQMGYRWDTYSFEEWTLRVLRGGLLNIYAPVDENAGQGMLVNHPPLGVALLSIGMRTWAGDPGDLPPDTHAVDLNPDYIQALKLPIMLVDLVLAGVGYTYAYAVTRRWRGLWATLTGVALAFNPALLIDSAWWGQTDSLLALFLALTVIALRFRRHTLAWVLYALAVLVKFQAAPLFPLLLVLTWRRDGVRGVMRGLIAAGVTALLVLSPFALTTGIDTVLRPYLGTVGQYPFVTIKAHNLWYWLLASSHNLTGDWFTMPFDHQTQAGVGIYVGFLSARMIGFMLLGVAVLVISVRAWRRPAAADEFLLAAALYTAFFMLSTQMQVRYLYPALVLLIFACVTRPQVILVAALMSVTVVYNILLLASHDFPFWQSLYDALSPIPEYIYALVNVVLMGVVFALLWLRRPFTRNT